MNIACGTTSMGVLTAALLAATALAGDFVLPEGDGKKLVESGCAGCHALDVLKGKQWTEARWQAAVASMVQKGARLDRSQSGIVTGYLAKNFGADRSRELVEDVCSQCHEWERVKEYPKTKEQWAGMIKGMISEGPPVTDDEFELIVAYLAKNYGPPND